MTDYAPSIMDVAEEARLMLTGAGVQTVTQMLEYLEIQDQQGFLYLLDHAAGLFERMAQSGMPAEQNVMFIAALYLAIGARLGKAGLM